MRRLLGACLAVWMAGNTAACYRTRIDVGSGPLSHRHGQADEENRWQDGALYHNAIYGLADFSGPIHLKRACPQGVAYIKQKTSFLGGLLRFLTSGLYTPQTVQVVCSDGGGSTQHHEEED